MSSATQPPTAEPTPQPNTASPSSQPGGGQLRISRTSTNAPLFEAPLGTNGAEQLPVDVNDLLIGGGGGEGAGGGPNGQAHPHGALGGPDGTNRFGQVRDRLFHVMLVKVALGYSRRVPRTLRRLIEAAVLLSAIASLALLVYVHVVVSQVPATCLAHIRDEWPRKGILRVEVIRNLEQSGHPLQALAHRQELYKHSQSTRYDLREILQRGPSALPTALQSSHNASLPPLLPRARPPPMSTLGRLVMWLLDVLLSPSPLASVYPGSAAEMADVRGRGRVGGGGVTPISALPPQPIYVYVLEYSLHHGLLRLSQAMRDELHVQQMVVHLDADADDCFGDWKERLLMRHLIGFEDLVMASVRRLADDETEKGYLKDLMTGDHYHFVSAGISRASYFTALLVMLIFTFAISMLLRFSHHQIFLFIVDLLQMFEMAQPIVFPVAPMLTVILALVGMEAIMSEIFNDTSTAFYVILLVWMADQYDAICCHSAVGKRYWLRFFYLYHFAFYVYQYKYNGQYGGIALVTSSLFILHSMVFFFHHYEMPLIVYQERIQHIITELQHNPNYVPSSSAAQPTIAVRMPSRRESMAGGSSQTAPSANAPHQINACHSAAEQFGEELSGRLIEEAMGEIIRRSDDGVVS